MYFFYFNEINEFSHICVVNFIPYFVFNFVNLVVFLILIVVASLLLVQWLVLMMWQEEF